MAVNMRIPVILVLIAFTSVQISQAHIVRRVNSDSEEDSVLETLRQSPPVGPRKRGQLQRESVDTEEEAEVETARRQLMDSAVGSGLSNGQYSVRVRNGRIRSSMAKGSMDTSDDDWMEESQSSSDTTLTDIADEIDDDSVRTPKSGPQDSVLDDYSYPMDENPAPAQPRRPPKKCTHCWIREEVRRIRIESIKQQILQKLRLEAPPNITKHDIPHIPHRHHLHGLLNKIGRQANDPTERLGAEVGAEDLNNYEDYYVNTFKSINFGETPPAKVGNDPQICYFTFKDDVIKARVEKAKLWVYLRNADSMSSSNPAGNRQALILVYQRLPPTTPRGQPQRRLILSKRIHPPPKGSEWHHFNITNSVANWTARPETNYGLYIEATDHTGKMLPVINPKTPAEQSFKPFVEVRIKDIGSNRQKRMSSRTCEEDDLERNCCRFPLKISFEEFGWDWVIAPKSYTANYCSGECPYIYAQDYQHTHLVQQAVPRNATICCTPRKMHALSMIYFADALNVVYGKVPEMVVDSCGCA